MKPEPASATSVPDPCRETPTGRVNEDILRIMKTPPGKVPVQSGRPPTGGPEIGGRKGLDPTRYGDWEKDGRCIDF